MAKKKNKTKVKLSFTIDGTQFNKVGKIENIHEHLQEVKRGTGVRKSKKTYSRKQKHKNKPSFLFAKIIFVLIFFIKSLRNLSFLPIFYYSLLHLSIICYISLPEKIYNQKLSTHILDNYFNTTCSIVLNTPFFLLEGAI